MFLHAWRLQFTHPATGERVALQAGLPPELHALMPPQAIEALAQHPTPTAND
jgi:23S rRNA pseudouridine955/2504/2580 synthase